VKRHLWLACAAIVVLSGSIALADSTMGTTPPAKVTAYTPAMIKWMPGTGLLKGVMFAALDGDMTKSGPFTFRLKLPDGAKFPVHYHPDTERATVISGILMVGIGPTFDESKMAAFPAGSFAVIPAGVRHYVEAKGETVIQISGTGPFAMEMDASPGTGH